MDILLAALMFLLGISLGSFLNVVADRVPLHQSIVSPPSHCFKCGQMLKRWDMVPVFSYLALKGRCRYCSAPVPLRSLVVEALTGLFFVLAWIRFGTAPQLLIALIYTLLLTVLTVIDLENHAIPAVIVYPGIIIILALSIFNPAEGSLPDLKRAVAGLTVGFSFFFVIWLLLKPFTKSMIKFSDAVMAGLIGASVGLPLILLVISLSIIVGSIIVVVWLLKAKKWPEQVPLGLIMSSGALVIIYFGGEISALWLPFSRF